MNCGQKHAKCEYSHQWESRGGQIACGRCGHLPTAKEIQVAEAILHLREVLKPGDTVYTVLRHVSRSGMSRNIDLYYMADGEPQWISGYVGHAIGSPQSRKNWERSQGLTVGGCGMDMGFHIVNSLSYVIFPQYQCLGKDGHCPSNYHVNHRDSVRCDGIARYALYALDDNGVMQKQATFGTRGETELAASLTPSDRRPEVAVDYLACFRSDTVRMPEIEIESGGELIKVSQGKAHTITREDGTEEICPVCNGHGRVPNPDGPERWDIVHKDGYALRHKWL